MPEKRKVRLASATTTTSGKRKVRLVSAPIPEPVVAPVVEPQVVEEPKKKKKSLWGQITSAPGNAISWADENVPGLGWIDKQGGKVTEDVAHQAASVLWAPVVSAIPGKQSGEKNLPSWTEPNPVKAIEQGGKAFKSAKLPPTVHTVLELGGDPLNLAPGVGLTTKMGIKQGLGLATKQDVLEQVGKQTVKKTAVAKVGDTLAEAEAAPIKATGKVIKAVTPQSVKKATDNLDTWVESHLTDRFAYINKSQGRVKSAGVKVAPDMDAETKISLLGGAAEKGTTIYKEAIKQVEEAVGKDKTLLPDVSEYLTLKHAHEIFMMKTKRQVVGNVKGPADAVQRLVALEERLGPEQFAKVRAGAEIVQQNYTKQLADMANAGLIEPKLAQFLYQNYPWYNTVKYMDEIIAHSEGISKVISNSNNGLNRLGEIGVEGQVIDPLNTLWLSNLKTETLIAKNEAAKATSKIFQNDPQLKDKVRLLADGEKANNNAGVISYMENGKRVALEIPKEAEEAVKQFNVIPKVDTFRFASAINAVSRAGTTTMNIAFFIPNIAVDGLTALITQGVGPVAVSRRLAYNLKGIVKDDPVMARMLKAKGGMSGFWGKSTEELTREATKNGNLVLKTDKDLKNFMLEPFRKIAEVGHAIEMSPRTAVFEKQLKKGATEEQAALAARRATIDFARAGTLVRELNSMFLYLNAGVQGTMVPFRAMRDIPAARLRATGYMALVASNYAYNRQFPEYQDVPNYYKYGAGLLFMVPSNDYDKRGNKIPHFITLIPNQREWALFSSPITYALSKMDGSNPQDFEMFIKDLVPRVNPLSTFTGQGGYPVPTQLGETMVSLWVNKDPFTGKEIVPPELQNLPADQQYDEYSSMAAIKAGSVLGMSPKKLEFFFKGVFGGVGSQLLEGVDYIDSKLAPDKPDERIQEMVDHLEGIQKTTAPEKIELARNEYLYSLSNEDREKVLALERHPSERMPILTNISRRVYHESGGQLYKTGQAIASKKTGISASQSRMASTVLSQVGAELQGSQEKIDAQLRDGLINGSTWKELRKALGQQYQGAMAAVKATYPRAAQSQTESDWQDWLTKVYTLGGAMPDIRSRANVLVSAYRSIVPEGELGQENWDTYFQRIKDFKMGLIDEDRAMLEQELQSRMTETEKQYQAAQDKLESSGYWDVEDSLFNDWSQKPGYGNLKELKVAWDRVENQMKNEGADSIQIKKAKIQQAKSLIQIEPYVALEKKKWKIAHPEEAKLLKLWYSY